MIIQLKSRVANLAWGWMEIASLQQVTNILGESLINQDLAEQIDEGMVEITRIGKRFYVTFKEEQAPEERMLTHENVTLEIPTEKVIDQVREIQEVFTHTAEDFKNLPKFNGLKK